MKTKLFLILFLLSDFLLSQSRENILKADLHKMKFFFINNNIPGFVNYLSYNIKINEEGLTKRIKDNQEKAESVSDSLVDFYYKDFSKPIKFNDKYQSSFIKVMIRNTPNGKIVKEYPMVGIFDEYDKQWRFIDTSVLSDEEVNVHFPALGDKIKSYVKPVLQYNFDNNSLINKCKDYQNIELSAISPITLKRQRIIVLENEKKDIVEDGYYLMDIFRDKNNPCKIKSILKDFKKEKTKFKIGDELDMEITAFDDDTYYFIIKFKDDKRLFFDDSTVVKKINP